MSGPVWIRRVPAVTPGLLTNSDRSAETYWVECAVTTLLAKRTVNKNTDTVAKT